MFVNADYGAPFAALDHLARAWRARADGPVRRALVVAFLASGLVLAHVARLGTPLARLSVAAILTTYVLACVVRSVRTRRRWRTPGGIVLQSIHRADPDLGARTLRAVRLVERTTADDSFGSPELARSHLTRLVARAGDEVVLRRATAIARRAGRVALLSSTVVLAALSLGPHRVLEGIDVLVARHHRAPLPLEWIEEPTLIVHPPDYLHERDRIVTGLNPIEVPRGSIVTFRADPLRAGRHLVLVDGAQEVPFADEASGGLVARWTVGDTTAVQVAARFGSVLIHEPGRLHIESVPDEAPQIALDGAPRTVKLLSEPVIVLRYEANDDHGLREIDLVVRTAGREERRRLSRLDGETRAERGAYRLQATDPLFQRAYAPVELTIEARDNDPITGPKWGRSAAITVIPPLVGEAEALRFEAWKKLRDAVVDAAAFRIEADPASDGARANQAATSTLTSPLPRSASAFASRESIREHLSKERELRDQVTQAFDRALDTSYGGLRTPRTVQMLARGQMRKLAETLSAEEKRASAPTHAAHRKVTEEAALTLDSALRRIDVIDATQIAKRLAEVADDAALGASSASDAADHERGLARLDAALGVLEGGGNHLRRLGTLGADLGEIVANDLRRVRRAQATDDYRHAELAARNLAARLRRPAPSFGAGRRGGVESGGAQGDEDGAGDASKQIAREQEQLEELARDHAAEMAGVEQAMNDQSVSERLEALRNEAREHARAIREAVRGLPRTGGEPGTAESAAATGREHAEAMADGLDRGDPAGATKSGKSALDALGQAQRSPLGSYFFPSDDPRADARHAENRLAPEVQWAQRVLDELRKAASAKAADELKRVGPREGKLADRARELAKQGSSGAGSLPGPTLDLLEGAENAMRDAADALQEAHGDRALDRQREAQRLLEMARSDDDSTEQESGTESDPASRRRGTGGEENGQGNLGSAAIPRADEYKGPDAFRKRVLEGLGSTDSLRLRGAVQRYAEGLLR